MSGRSRILAERLKAFNEEVIDFVRNCSDEDWKKMSAEEWTVGVTARHIGAGHYSASGIVAMIVNGEKIPEISMEEITRMANRHAEDHADCTREEVSKVLRENGAELVEFIKGLGDAELDRTGFLALIGKEITAEKVVESIILRSGGEHFANMKAAVRS